MPTLGMNIYFIRMTGLGSTETVTVNAYNSQDALRKAYEIHIWPSRFECVNPDAQPVSGPLTKSLPLIFGTLAVKR